MAIIILSLLLVIMLTACRELSTTTLTTAVTTAMPSTTLSSGPVTQSTLPVTETSSTEPTSAPAKKLIDHVEIVTDVASTNKLVEIGLFEETGVEIIADLYNPYDYNQIRIEMILTSPSQKSAKHYAFWFRQYQELMLIGETYDDTGYLTGGQELVRWLDEGISHYMVRMRPDEAGVWNYNFSVIIEDAIVQSENGSFTVSEAEAAKGYISVDQANMRKFVFDNGSSYFPNGANFGWWATSLGTHDYYNWFKALNEHGGNYARVWLSNRAFAIHRDSYVNFDSTQNIAIRLDRLFEFAEEFGVYVMLTLINHGQFSTTTNPNWGANPYNSANGGMLDLPIQFFYNSQAKTAYKNELMYLLARYGHSENLFAWELFNEVDWVDGYNSGVVTMWHSEMARFIKENDPYRHLVTTSYKYPYDTDAYALDSLDFCAVHSYEYYDKLFYGKLLSETDTLASRYDKPVFFGEIGIDWRSGSATYGKDPSGITLHQGLWGGIMGGAGGAMQWWWDSWIDLYDLWYRFAGVGAYIKLMDLGGTAYSDLRNVSGISISNQQAGMMGYVALDKVYGYLYHKQWNYFNPDPVVLEDITIVLPMANGTYALSIYDTVTGAITASQYITVTNGNLQFSIPTLAYDLAFIINNT